MTKLIQWMLFLFSGLLFWISCLNLLPTDLVYDSNGDPIPSLLSFVVRALPVLTIVLFGLYSLVVIGYRVSSFNDCQNESDALKLEIDAARKALTAKGYKF
ncbi:dolichol-phosphate mannosyltransferase subunit 3-like [Symsagittifera roscoffensis]|uniref:dolichol-phosphate mannosyltransferase subunit 3-like n=1 Tax=Symsagittifera roscoffensis TaxID=84072 RepID=UPI00307C653A